MLIIYFIFVFLLYNSTGEARPHLPPLTARPCIIVTSRLTIIVHKEKITIGGQVNAKR